MIEFEIKGTKFYQISSPSWWNKWYYKLKAKRFIKIWKYNEYQLKGVCDEYK